MASNNSGTSLNLNSLHQCFGISTAFFIVCWWYITNKVLLVAKLMVKIGLPKALFEPNKELSHVIEPGFKSSSLWKYENIIFSLTHVLVSGPLAIIFFIIVHIENPELNILDASEGTSPTTPLPAYFAVITFANSVGYFIVDFTQLLFIGGGLSQWPHLIHHVIFPMLTCMLLKNFQLIYLLMSVLLVEWTNIILHPRNLGRINKLNPELQWYRNIKTANFILFGGARFIMHGFYTWFIFANKNHLVATVGFPGWLCMVIAINFLNFIITVFVIRLWKSDIQGGAIEMENDMGG